MMSNEDKIVLVREWYTDPIHWRDDGKGEDCVDYILLAPETMIRGKKVLNIGCFYPADDMKFGSLAEEWIGIDFLSQVVGRCKMIREHEQLGEEKIKFLCLDATELPASWSNSFDTVIDFSTGDQMPDDAWHKMLDEVMRVLRADGHFVTTFADLDYFQRAEVVGEDCGYSRCRSIDTVAEELRVRGMLLLRIIEGKDVGRAGILAQKLR